MNKTKKVIRFTFISLYIIIAISAITLLTMKYYGIAILISVPSVFLIPIYLTFHKIPKKTNQHVFFLVISIISRYLLAIIAMLTPALIWYYIPTIKENTNAIFLLLPFIEIIFIYTIVIVQNIIESKPIKDKESKHE